MLGIPSVPEKLRLLSEKALTLLPSQSFSEAPVPVFLAEPATLLFSDYTVGRVYEVGLSFFL